MPSRIALLFLSLLAAAGAQAGSFRTYHPDQYYFGLAMRAHAEQRYGESLAIGTNATPVYGSSELLLNSATVQGVAALKAAFQPDVILYDMPPMLQSDDTMAFLPHVDCVLLVAAAEKSRLDEVDKCEQELAEQTNVLGVVLNKCRYTGADYGYY